METCLLERLCFASENHPVSSTVPVPWANPLEHWEVIEVTSVHVDHSDPVDIPRGQGFTSGSECGHASGIAVTAPTAEVGRLVVPEGHSGKFAQRFPGAGMVN